jgi:SAM-dependent methyltransferase
MLDLAEVRPGEVLADLGSGDGRIVAAALRRGALAMGCEIDPELVAASQAQGLHVVQRDLFEVGLSWADVVTAYLSPHANELLQLKFERELKPGARVVTMDFEFPGWRYEKFLPAPEDHMLFLYSDFTPFGFSLCYCDEDLEALARAVESSIDDVPRLVWAAGLKDWRSAPQNEAARKVDGQVRRVEIKNPQLRRAEFAVWLRGQPGMAGLANDMEGRG